MTETPLLSMALGVIAKDAARMASLKPGTLRSAISSVASGVQSLGEKPVPHFYHSIACLFHDFFCRRAA